MALSRNVARTPAKKAIASPNKVKSPIKFGKDSGGIRLSNLNHIRSWNCTHPGIHIIALERAICRGTDSYVNDLVKAVDQNLDVAKACNLFAHTKRKGDPSSDLAIENESNKYLRRLFVSIDTDKTEILTDEERMVDLMALVAVSC